MMLVVGATGQVARALAEAGECRCLGRDVIDLAKPETIRAPILEARPTLVVNAAAYTAVDRAEEEEALAGQVNGASVGELAAAAAEVGAPLIHFSTDYVYAGDKPAPYVETDPVAPINAYGASKLAGEVAALEANPRTLILRTAWVYAPWGKNFALTMLRLAGRERLTVVDDQTGSPTSALDIADAVHAIAPAVERAVERAEADIWGPCHYAGAGSVTWAGFAEAVFEGAVARGLIDRRPEVARIPTSDYPTPARRPANSVLDCARFEKLFGRAPVAWEAGLGRVLDRVSPS